PRRIGSKGPPLEGVTMETFRFAPSCLAQRQPPVHEATGGHGFEGTISLPSSSIRLCFAVILARNWASWCSHRQNPPSAHGIGLPGARIAQIAPPRTELASLVLASPKSPLRARNWPP
ncbi:MAG: hypothetical protein J6X64_00095, partial [Bacteroidales bacterium]|nr:hypothetical protein [Bacteroidales bacterium]